IQDKRIIVGKIESGMVDAGQEVKILPRGTLTKIQSIERFNETSHQAFAGESIGLTTVDPAFVDRSNIICERETGVMLTDEISGNIFWMSKQAFKKEERLTLRLATQEVICTVEKIVRRINSSSLEVLEEDAQCLENLEVGEVIMKTKRPIVIKKFSELQGLGRFVLVRGDHICAGGIIV
ncbi:MAG: EF-Tu/IF-2/RF-3 family GTPase, partial [Candidatus Omnitrophota bacterium]